VLAVASNHQVITAAGKFTAAELAARFRKSSWQIRSAGAGSKGPRWYSWAFTPIIEAGPGQRWLLLRRNDSTGELAFYRSFCPNLVPLRQLIRVAGWRWKIEESFQTAKGQAGLDEHQVRRWCSWHRWVTLAMAAMAFLAVVTAAEHDQSPHTGELIPLTLNELRHLFDALTAGAIATTARLISWSIWRRKHQYQARLSHYHRRSQAHDHDLLL